MLVVGPAVSHLADLIAAGKCPSCWGEGWVERCVPVDHEGPCSTCLGTGTWPPAEDEEEET